MRRTRHRGRSAVPGGGTQIARMLDGALFRPICR